MRGFKVFERAVDSSLIEASERNRRAIFLFFLGALQTLLLTTVSPQEKIISAHGSEINTPYNVKRMKDLLAGRLFLPFLFIARQFMRTIHYMTS